MEISTSILSIKENLKEKVLLLKNTNTSYIHLDVMDGKFVDNISSYIDIKEEILKTDKKIDIHFMVENVENYLETYKELKPEYMTFHIESTFNQNTIKRIKEISKVGIAINPTTNIKQLKPYLNQIDLVLLMSVNPGHGGQEFMMSTIDRLKELNEYQKEYNFKIEIDGGINKETIKYVKDADIIVSGSFITNSNNFEERIKELLS